MKELLIDGEGLNKQEESVWIGRSGGSSALAIFSCDVHVGKETSETIDR